MRNRPALARSAPSATMVVFPINNAALRHRKRTPPWRGDEIGGSRSRKPRGYLTSFSSGRRRGGGFGYCSRSAAESSCTIASHKAFSSESVIRLSFIRSSRIATDTNWAVSRLELSIRPARHCSSVARITCNRCSELVTSVSSIAQLARKSRFNQIVCFKCFSINSGERSVSVARQVIPFEHHFVAIRFRKIWLITVRLETLDATVGGGNTVEKCGFRDHVEKGNRKA
jgi:hypothetical protein